MTRFLRTLVASLALAAAVSTTGSAFAGEAQDLVQAKRTQVADMLKSAAGADRDKKVAAVLGGLFDFDAMAKASLGDGASELNDDQKAEFATLLKQLVQRTIEKNVRATINYDVAFLGEDPAGDDVVVKTRAQNKKNEREEPILIDYRLKKGDAGWRSIDVVTEGSSMVANYRSQFKRILAKDGAAGLLKKMRDKAKRDGASALVGRRSSLRARRPACWPARGAERYDRLAWVVRKRDSPSAFRAEETRTRRVSLRRTRSRCAWRSPASGSGWSSIGLPSSAR